MNSFMNAIKCGHRCNNLFLVIEQIRYFTLGLHITKVNNWMIKVNCKMKRDNIFVNEI